VTEPVDQTPEEDPLNRQAIAWIVRLTSGEATTADAAEVKRWRGQSPAHEEAFRRAAKLWKDFGKAAAHVSQGEQVKLGAHKFDRVMARRAFLGGITATAAATAGYVMVRPPLGLWPSWGELLADYRTSKGEQRQIVINPAVSLELSTLTSVSVRSSEGQPRIDLISGEAAITAMTAQKPLIVTAGDIRITTSHATFNTRCIDGAVVVTCLTGEVDVEQGTETAQLLEGQQISYSATGLGRVKDVDIAQATSWRSGMLIFHNKPLTEVIEEINRYRPGRIVVTNADLGRRVVNGTFRRDQLDTFIAQVQHLFGAKVTTLPAGLTLLS
jgi:transmembrane sensor